MTNSLASQDQIQSIAASAAPGRKKSTTYPEPFASRMQGRTKQPLGDLFGLTNFGVNLTTVAPGGVSALRHFHSKQDEFVYIVSGTATLLSNTGASQLTAGMCAGFKAASGNAHHIKKASSETLIYLEVGDRSPEDQVTYPDDDLAARLVDGEWEFTHKNGAPYLTRFWALTIHSTRCRFAARVNSGVRTRTELLACPSGVALN